MSQRFWARALRGAVLTAAFAGLVVGGQAAAAAPAISAVDFTGIVALSNCSGSVVRTPTAVSTDPALVMSNGHCFRLLNAGQVVQNVASSRTFSLLNSSGTGTLGTLRANRMLYATMTKTDVSIYRLNITYGQLQAQFPSTRPVTLSTVHPTAGEPIRVVSGFHRTIYSCNIDNFVFQLREDVWTWQDSIRYTPACMTIPGTSGSPVIDANTNQMVGINNTGNENGERCTLDNPCEVDQNGTVTVRQGINYAQETFYIAPCIGPGSVIDLTRSGCGLPR